MSAHRGRGSLWHLNLTRFTLGAGLVLLLALPGCPRTSSDEEKTEETGATPRTGREIRRIVDGLYAQKGEDAYTDPSLDPLLVELEALARGGDKDAASLRGLILAKRRLALRAQSGEPRTPELNLTRRGRVTYEDPAPEDDDRIERAEAVAVGTSRDELREAYGSCLIRQTWFAARGPGGVTTELFHVAPDCREKLKPRVFRVAEDEVKQVSDGDLDGVMEPSRNRPTEG